MPAPRLQYREGIPQCQARTNKGPRCTRDATAQHKGKAYCNAHHTIMLRLKDAEEEEMKLKPKTNVKFVTYSMPRIELEAGWYTVSDLEMFLEEAKSLQRWSDKQTEEFKKLFKEKNK